MGANKGGKPPRVPLYCKKAYCQGSARALASTLTISLFAMWAAAVQREMIYQEIKLGRNNIYSIDHVC